MQDGPRIEQRRECITVAREALSGIGASLWQAPSGGGLAELLGELDALGAACEAAKTAVVAEAIERGETSRVLRR